MNLLIAISFKKLRYCDIIYVIYIIRYIYIYNLNWQTERQEKKTMLSGFDFKRSTTRR